MPPPNQWRSNPAAKDYVRVIELAAKEAGIDPDLLGAVIERESQFDPRAESGAGAAGIAQIISRFHPGVDVSDPVASIKAAAHYLKANMKRFGDTPRALAAYNHGPTAVRSYGADWKERIPTETQNYVAALSPDAIIEELRK